MLCFFSAWNVLVLFGLLLLGLVLLFAGHLFLALVFVLFSTLVAHGVIPFTFVVYRLTAAMLPLLRGNP